MKTIVKALATIALATVATASFAKSNPVNAAQVTSTKTVNYVCQDGRVAVKYGFNAAGVPVNAIAKVNGATRVMKYDMSRSDNVDAFFKDAAGYRLNADAFERNSVHKTAINITSPRNDLVFKNCSPR